MCTYTCPPPPHTHTAGLDCCFVVFCPLFTHTRLFARAEEKSASLLHAASVHLLQKRSELKYACARACVFMVATAALMQKKKKRVHSVPCSAAKHGRASADGGSLGVPPILQRRKEQKEGEEEEVEEKSCDSLVALLRICVYVRPTCVSFGLFKIVGCRSRGTSFSRITATSGFSPRPFLIGCVGN